LFHHHRHHHHHRFPFLFPAIAILTTGAQTRTIAKTTTIDGKAALWSIITPPWPHRRRQPLHRLVVLYEEEEDLTHLLSTRAEVLRLSPPLIVRVRRVK